MSSSNRIENNNVDLQEILDKVNTLPEAGSGETGTDPSYNMVKVINNTGADIIIGLYKLQNGEFVKLPFNLPDTRSVVSFITSLEENTFVSSSASIFPVSVEKLNADIPSGGSSISVTTGCLILNSSGVENNLEIIVS